MATPAQWATIKYFLPEEMACRHCGVEQMSYAFLVKLDQARAASGVPFQITSGSRCAIYNPRVGGSKTSSHLFTPERDSCAVDVNDRKDPVLRGRILTACWDAGIRQCEVSKDGHTHLMDDATKPSPFVGIE